jgi:hypothetical protein
MTACRALPWNWGPTASSLEKQQTWWGTQPSDEAPLRSAFSSAWGGDLDVVTLDVRDNRSVLFG